MQNRNILRVIVMLPFFTPEGFYSVFKNISVKPKSTGSSENFFALHTDEFNGSIIRAEIEQELALFDWDLQVIKRTVLHNDFLQTDGGSFYVITYHYGSDFESVKYKEEAGKVYKKLDPCLLISADGKDIEFSYKAGAVIQCVSLAFTHQWLLRQLVDVKEKEQITPLLLLMLSSTILRPLSKAEIILARELSQELRSDSRALIIKSHIYNLLSILYRHVSINGHSSREFATYADIMTQVEKELTSHLLTRMPSVETLSGKFLLSNSTLTRHFRATFGMSINEYYIQKKMELAKDLLQQRKSVSEVTSMLGYESVSHFIVMFKKIHGYSPGKENRAK